MASKSCQLQEITTCWEKRTDGSTGKQIECPPHVLGSGRNSAILNGCQRLLLDISDGGGACSVVTKDMLRALKDKQ